MNSRHSNNQTDRPITVWGYQTASVLGILFLIAQICGTVPMAYSQSAVYVDDQPAAQALIKQALFLYNQRRLTESATRLQKLMEQYPRSVTHTQGSLHTDALRWTRQFIASNPQLLDTYRELHDPLAQHALKRALTPAPNLSALDALVQKYFLSPSGLEAGLALSALLLEKGRPLDAAGVLDQLQTHPSLPTKNERWHLLQCIAGLYGNDARRLDQHEQELRLLKSIGALGSLAKLKSSLERHSDKSFSSVDLLPKAEIPKAGKPFWIQQTPTKPEYLKTTQASGPIYARGYDPEEAYLLPVLHQDVIFVNDGQSLLAYQRYTGRSVWAKPFKLDPKYDQKQFQYPSGRPRPYDQRNVAIAGRRLIAVMGFAPGTSHSSPKGSGGLICVDKNTGRLLWQYTPVQLHPKLDNTYMHGIVQQAGGRIYLVLNRSQPNGGRSAYVAAVNAQDGKLLWYRLVSNVSTSRLGMVSPLARFTLTGGRLYMADNLGIVCCLNSRTGSMIWLRANVASPKTAAEADRRARLRLSTGKVARPILLDKGLLVAFKGDATNALLLDPDTGQQIINEKAEPVELSAAQWNQADHLIKVGSDVLSIGKIAYLIDGQSLKMKWKAPMPDQAGLVGRPCVTKDLLIVPLRKHLHLIKLVDGKPLDPIPYFTQEDQDISLESGNVLALDGQLIISTRDNRLVTHIAFDHIVKLLRTNIKQNPEESAPGLTLAEVAIMSLSRTPIPGEAQQALLDGLDHALAVSQQPQSKQLLQEQIFRRIVTLLDQMKQTDLTLRNQLFDRLARSAVYPQQKVAFRLRKAAFLLQNGQSNLALQRAIDLYQSILNNPTLWPQMTALPNQTVSAGYEARRRLEQWYETAGPGQVREIYASHDQLALELLENLEAKLKQSADLGARPSRQLIDEFQGLTDSFPIAHAAPKALWNAAEAYRSHGDDHRAIGQLHKALHSKALHQEASLHALLGQIVGRLADTYQKLGKPDQAQWVLLKAQKRHPNLRALRGQEQVSIDAWLSDLASKKRIELTLPNFTAPMAAPKILSGQLLTSSANRPAHWATDSVLIAQKGQIHFYRDPALAKPLWSRTIKNGLVRLLAMNRNWIFLLDGHELSCLSKADGNLRWGPVDLNRAIKMEPNAADEQAIPDLLSRVAFNDQLVCLADPLGRILSIDIADGKLLWRQELPLRHLTHLSLHEQVLALAGTIEKSGRQGMILALDPASGRPLFPGKLVDPPNWLNAQISNRILYSTRTSLSALDLHTGKRLWQTQQQIGMALTGVGAVHDRQVLLQQRNGSVLMVTLVTGKQPRQVVASQIEPTERNSISIMAVADQWQIQTHRQLVSLSAQGKMCWEDSISQLDRGGSCQGQLISRQCILAFVEQPGTKGKVTYRLLLLDRKRNGGVLNPDLQASILPLDHPVEQAILLNGRLIIGSGQKIIVISGRDVSKAP
jgi:outer membrane protein assembly factor BamB